MEITPNILVVEDEAPIRMIWDRFLKRWGYQADLAENGRQGLDMARARPYDLMITDLTMPEITGQELVHILKAEQPNLEIIVTTGQGTIELAVEMIKAGAYEFITKPISFNRAEFVVKKCFEKIQAQQENLRLLRKTRDLEELNQIKEKFITITSHELRTPVGVINNIVEMLAPEFKGKEEEHLFNIIVRSSQHLNEIVTQMHDLAGSSTAKLKIELTRFGLREIWEDVAEELELVLKDRLQTLTLNIPPQLEIQGDRTKLKKVARELLQNAIKFTPNQGSIAVEGGLSPQGEALISVSDTGIGIPQGELENIFQMFYEVGDALHHHTSKNAFKGGGMGIGLKIVMDIVHGHGGKIDVTSQEGKGSTFTVTLPQTNPAG
ncbi:MAG: response regulator [Deltaproteobacteria bacterium]|nr:response regulator [Deltaproteobacteria bacterium]